MNETNIVTYWEMRKKVDNDSFPGLCPPVRGRGAGNEGHREIRHHQGHHNVPRKGISQKID